MDEQSRKKRFEQLQAALEWTVISRVWYLFRPIIKLLLALRARLRGTSARPVPHMSREDGVEVLINTLGAEPVKPPERIRDLEKKLWSGYSRYALEDLERVLHARSISSHDRADVAWVLARWCSAHGDFEKALLYAVLMRSLHPAEGWSRGQVLLEVGCLNRLGRQDEARAMLDHVLAVEPVESDYCLAYANCLMGTDPADAAEARLTWINRIYEQGGFAPVALRNPSLGLTIENLSAPTAEAGSRDDPARVSVLMPAYNCADTIEKAIRGLLAQTWANLEIIVVDDCSPDETGAVLEAFAARDERVVAIRHEQNTGAYGARLTALERASGEFITVHDADDWSHPQKIEAQVAALRADPQLVACMSSWCRVSRSMYVNRVGAIPSDSFRRQNESSLMFRRSLVDTIGCWDRVRAAADTEYIWRIQAAFGKDAVRVIHPDIPLSFSLHQEDSLTRTGPTHVRTIFQGTRRVYREAQKWWHRQAESPADLKLDGATGKRPFYCPPNLLEKQPPRREYDLLLVADFAKSADAGAYAASLVHSAVALGLSVAIFHWRRYDENPMSAVRETFQALAAQGRLDIVAAEDALAARHAIVADAMAPRHLLERLPDWQVGQLWVASGHPEGSGFPDGVAFDLRVVAAHVGDAFGVAPSWLPVFEADARVMQDDARFESVADGVLGPVLSPVADGDMSRDASGAGSGRRPRVGRAALGGALHWPETVDALASAYCAGQACDVVLAGVPRALENGIDRWPANWRLEDHRELDRDTLALDFFLYWPGGAVLEGAGLPILDAMDRGEVVVTHPAFRPIFGDAAVYAEPEAVWPTVRSLWEDPEQYREQAARGRRLALSFTANDGLAALVSAKDREQVR